MPAHLAVIGIVVSEMARSLAFYRALGLDIPEAADAAPHAECAIGAGTTLTWDTYDTIRAFDPAWTPSTGGHAMALSFRCDSPAEVDAVYARMTGLGYTGHVPPWDAVWRQRYAVLHDPDGNPVELFAPLS